MTCAMCDMVHKEALALRATVAALASPHRKIKEVISRPEDGVIFVICEDGTLWYRGCNWEADRDWLSLPPVPGGEIRSKREDSELARTLKGSTSDLTDSDATMVHDVQAYQKGTPPDPPAPPPSRKGSANG